MLLSDHTNQKADDLRNRTGILFSLTRRSPGLSAERGFGLGHGGTRVWWSNVGAQMKAVGIGKAAIFAVSGPERFVHAREAVTQKLDSLVDFSAERPYLLPRVFGGFSFFDEEVAAPEWGAFGAGLFCIPEYQWVDLDGECWVTVNKFAGNQMDHNQVRERLGEALDAIEGVENPNGADGFAKEARMENRGVESSRAQWDRMVLETLDAINRGSLEKAVLTRRVALKTSRRPSLENLIAELQTSNSACYPFVFEPQFGNAFFGSSPELLVAVQDAKLSTVALAGTTGRGGCEEEDNALSTALLADSKERKEHQLVVDGIRDSLANVCANMRVDSAPKIRRLKNLQHLETSIEGQLRQDMHILDVVGAMHPTAALCGTPRLAASKHIRRIEPDSRGWFGGPIGWVDEYGCGEFAVGIRSALLAGENLFLYAGAGIVEGSTPQREWDETTLKLQSLERILLEPQYDQP